MEEVFRECIAEERDAGRTVLLSSHILSEVEALCDRVSIIRAGPHRRVRHADRAAPPDPHLDHPELAARRTAWPACPACTTSQSRAPGPGRAPGRHRQLDAVLRRSPPAGVRSLTSTPPTLEELFLRHYQDDARDEAAIAR